MRVRAKRLGWDEQLTHEQLLDLESFEEHGYKTDEWIEGEHQVVEFKIGGKTREMHLVGGQEADPDTIEEVK